jgi:hypothetical protein
MHLSLHVQSILFSLFSTALGVILGYRKSGIDPGIVKSALVGTASIFVTMFTFGLALIASGIKLGFKFGLGLSAKIRDAGVSLQNSALLSENFSIGFAPLINLLGNWDISQKMGIDFFGEGIAASKGRAIDFSLSGRSSLSKNLQGNIGYRQLEGGANGTIRYNFIRLHFIFASLNYSFNKNN